MRRLIEEGYKASENILTEHMDQLHFLAKYLMKFEKINDVDFEKLMKGEMDESIVEPVTNSTESPSESDSETDDNTENN